MVAVFSRRLSIILAEELAESRNRREPQPDSYLLDVLTSCAEISFCVTHDVIANDLLG